MTSPWPDPAYTPAYELLTAAENHLAALHHAHRVKYGHSAEPHAAAAMYALQYATLILQPAVPDTHEPAFLDNAERLLELMKNWRDAALGLGEFAPAAPDTALPALRLVPGRRSDRP
ncbi:hypothetical protein [Kitasatospora sp. NPDC088134]|uniref:hypothetical protein n=1 Tax=Kitasatospora sp. NPDC088134 TaxID=3364071 RepID=UPI003826BCF7